MVLRRSHPQSHGWSLIIAYLLVAVLVGSTYLFDEYQETETVNGSLFATATPTIGRSAAGESVWGGILGKGFIGFVRLVPVVGQLESDARLPSEVSSFGRRDQHGSALPPFYCRIFSESDLMSRLEMGTIYYTIYSSLKNERSQGVLRLNRPGVLGDSGG